MRDGSSASRPPTLAEVPEGVAAGELALIYGDIRATLGVPLVNLIYRHLATVPGALEWAWQSLRPHFASGALSAQAARLRDVVRTQTAHLSVSLDEVDTADPGIAALVAVYNAANSQNLMALTHLLGLGAADAGPVRMAGLNPSSRAEAQPLAASLRPLPSLEVLRPEDRAAAVRLNQYAEPGTPQVLASLYRHLGAWPGLLPQIEQALAPFHENGQLAAARVATVREARRIAGLQALPMPAASPPGATELLQRMQAFADVTIPKMVPIGLALQSALARSPISLR